MLKRTRQHVISSSSSLRTSKRVVRPVARLMDEQSYERKEKIKQKILEEIQRKKIIEMNRKLQEVLREEKKKIEIFNQKAKAKREAKLNEKRKKENSSIKFSSKSTKKGKGKSSKDTTKKSRVAKRSKSAISSFDFGSTTGTFSSLPSSFLAPSTATPPSIQARTDVDLMDYNYGIENTSAANQLDLVFCLDCTASMGSIIRSCQDSIVNMVNTIRASEGQDVRFCLIPYRDHHLGEEYCTKVYPFTRDTSQMLKNVNAQSAGGGGDGPESVTAALCEAVCLDWRDNASKLVVFMADAGPHGLENSGDSYPNGDPDGKDPLALSREMIGLGISVYPILASGGWSRPSQICQDFFAAIAMITGGQCLDLGDANLLSDAIISGVQENIDLEANLAQVRVQIEEATKTKGAPLTEDETAAITASITASNGKKLRSLPDDKLIKITFEKFSQVTESSTLAELKVKWNGTTFSLSAPVATETVEKRMARMAGARDARLTDPVMIECVKEGSKIRARVISPGYNPDKNCQFPRDIREDGKKFLVDGIIDAGSFYRVKGNIVPV